MAPKTHAQQFVAIALRRRRGEIAIEAALFSDGSPIESTEFVLPGRSEKRSSGPADTELVSIRRLITGRRLIAAQSERVAETLAQLGIHPSRDLVAIGELTAAIVPGLANLPIERIAASIPRHNGSENEEASGAVELGRLYSTLIGQLAAFDDLTVQRLATHATSAGWSSATALLEIALARQQAPGSALSDSHLLSASEIAYMTNRERPEPLKPTGVKSGVEPDEISHAFAERGSFSAINPAFEHRSAQLELSLAVGDALNNDGWLMAEAGTGTGKSLAYLLPAALFAAERGERVVVSTNTRALQDQLIGKDVPELTHAITAEGQAPPVVAMLKGRSNYICMRRWFHTERQAPHSHADAGMRAKINLWLPRTESGDRAELALAGDEQREFGAVSAEGEACIPAKCIFQQRNQCFLYRARREAEAAHLLVVNHALLMTDLGDSTSVLPQFERLIIDEAHHLEDQATNQFGFSIGESTIWDLGDRVLRYEGTSLAGALPEAAGLLLRTALTPEEIERAHRVRDRLIIAGDRVSTANTRAVELFRGLHRIAEESSPPDTGFGRELRVTLAIRRGTEWSQIEIAADHLNAALRDIVADLTWTLGQVEEVKPADEEDPTAELLMDSEFELTSTLMEFADLGAHLDELLLNPKSDGIYWIEIANATDRTSFHAAPLNVGPLLKERIYERMRSVIMTSATMTTDGNFDFVKSRLGFEDADELELPSPFDYRSAAKLYLVDDIPEPQQPNYQQGVEDSLLGLGSALEGRTLALFTSYGALRSTYRAIRDPLAEAGIDLFAQGIHGTPAQLVERLRAGSNTMVLGTATFWEGVDVVGPALSALVIAKLPFAVPSDPVFAARSELVDEPFMNFAVPQSVLRFKQGFGRLIRSSHDRGICVILDRRVLTKRYGRSFIQSLPECTVQVGGRLELGRSAVAWLNPEGEERADD